MTQARILSEMQDAGFNVCTCGNCGGVLLALSTDKELTCNHCDSTLAQEHCPDLYYVEKKKKTLWYMPYIDKDGNRIVDIYGEDLEKVGIVEGRGSVEELIDIFVRGEELCKEDYKFLQLIDEKQL